MRERVSRLALGAAAVATAAAVLTGCASSGGSGTGAGGGTGGGTTSSAPSPSHTVRLDSTDNGKRMSVPKGATVVVTLDNLYWHLSPVSSPALAHAKVVVHPKKSRIPGMGTGTVVATYHAVAAGRAVVTANRTVCGEAMACSPAQSHFHVTLIVH